MNDNVKHPAHYTDGGIETIDYIRAKLTPEEFIGYCKGNALKYISRAGKKGDASEDLAKAAVYLGWASDTPTDAKTAPQTDETPKVDKEPDKVQKTSQKPKMKPSGRKSDIDDDKLRKLYEDGKGLGDLAKQFGVSQGCVTDHLKKMGVFVPKTAKKIDDGKIRACYEGGRTVSWIADEMGLAPQTIINHLTKMGIYKTKRVTA